MHLPFRTRTAHRACISPVVIMESKGLMRLITARVGFCRCAGKMYFFSDAWPSSTFTTVSSRKGKAKVYRVAKTMISMGSSFGLLLNTTEFSFISFTLGLMSTFPVTIRPGSSLFSTGSLSCVLDINTDEEEICQGPVQPALPPPSLLFILGLSTPLGRRCQSWEKLPLWEWVHEWPRRMMGYAYHLPEFRSLRRKRPELSLTPASLVEFQHSAITVTLEIAECWRTTRETGDFYICWELPETLSS